MRKLFPLTIQTDPGSSVTLFADGRCTGNLQMLELWMSTVSMDAAPTPPVVMSGVMVWLLVRAMQDDKRRGRAPRA